MIGLDVTAPDFFDEWRKHYYDLSHEENIRIGRELERLYPHQVSFDAQHLDWFFKNTPAEPRVLEVGGWKGEAARYSLARYPIKSWINVDMCLAAIEKTVCTDWRYHASFPPSFDWFVLSRRQEFDAFVCLHTIEHLTDLHALALFDHIAGIPHLLFEAPIGPGESDWRGYPGTHILRGGWDWVVEELHKRGYARVKLSDTAYCFEAVV